MVSVTIGSDWNTEMDAFYYEGYEEALEKVLGT
jgi:hypothetical protein